MAIACGVREIRQHEFTYANQIHENYIWLTSGAHSSKSDAHDGLLSESTETRLSSGACPIFIAPCVLALQALESDRLREAEFGTDCSKKHSCERLIPGHMCIPGAQESAQLSRLLNNAPVFV